MDDEEVAQLFHETYEKLAPQFGYPTRRASAVPWEKVPGRNKALMIAVAGYVMDEVRGKLEPSPACCFHFCPNCLPGRQSLRVYNSFYKTKEGAKNAGAPSEG